MAAVPIHAAVAVPAEYSLAFASPGAPAAVNASDMKVEVESSHWFVSVAAHELSASGLRYVVPYAQLNELMWSVAECDAGLQSVRFVQVAVELAWLQDLLQACLNAGLPRSPLRSWSAVCAVLGRCAQSLSGAAAATRRLSAGDLRRLQTSGSRGTHGFSGASTPRLLRGRCLPGSPRRRRNACTPYRPSETSSARTGRGGGVLKAPPWAYSTQRARGSPSTCVIIQARDWCYSAFAACGQPHSLRRPPAAVLGAGMFESFSTLDGSRAPACVSIWTFDASSGRPRLFDWSQGFRSQFSVAALVDFLGDGDDQLTLATLSRGTLFLTDPPRHMRLLPNRFQTSSVVHRCPW